jgi:hypothetical protein
MHSTRDFTDLTGNLVLFYRNEIQLFVEMHFPQSGFLDHPMIQFPLDFHHKEQHVIVGSTGKEDFAGI